jgi:hypothetical protein
LANTARSKSRKNKWRLRRLAASHSAANPGFKLHKRYVDSYGWADYDNAVLKGDCREVIDKGTPLKRQR